MQNRKTEMEEVESQSSDSVKLEAEINSESSSESGVDVIKIIFGGIDSSSSSNEEESEKEDINESNDGSNAMFLTKMMIDKVNHDIQHMEKYLLNAYRLKNLLENKLPKISPTCNIFFFPTGGNKNADNATKENNFEQTSETPKGPGF